MFWEELTAEEFEKAVKEEQVCVIPMGVIEKHGSHLPLATDMLLGREIARLAAKIEPFVIFPYYYFGQINEARHVPGTIAVSPKMQMDLLDEVIKEIRRNGFRKIVLLESHGGNINWLDYFLQGQLHEKRDYIVYKIGIFDIIGYANEKLMQSFSDEDGHAAKMETEFVMAVRDDLVHMEWVNPEGAINLHRLDHIKGANTPISWYSDHPTHQEGDPTHASKDLGEKRFQYAADYVADLIKKIKTDNKALELLEEYFKQW